MKPHPAYYAAYYAADHGPHGRSKIDAVLAAVTTAWTTIDMAAQAAACSRVWAKQVLQHAAKTGHLERAKLRPSRPRVMGKMVYRRPQKPVPHA